MFYANLFFLVMIEVVFFHSWICYKHRSHDGFLSAATTEGRKWPVAFQLQIYMLVRFAGFQWFLGSIPRWFHIIPSKLCFEGFRWRSFKNTNKMLSPTMNQLLHMNWLKTEKSFWIAHLFLSHERFSPGFWKKEQACGLHNQITRLAKQLLQQEDLYTLKESRSFHPGGVA